MALNIILPHKMTSLECYLFITHVRKCVMGATPMAAGFVVWEFTLYILILDEMSTTCAPNTSTFMFVIYLKV